MKITTKVRYGTRALLVIANAKDNQGVLQKDIVTDQDLSNKYLDHIIHSLKTAGIICNQNGKKSGYHLCKKPKDISLLDIYSAFEPGVCLVECLSPTINCPRSPDCKTQPVWKALNGKIITYMRSISLEDIINGRDFDSEMF